MLASINMNVKTCINGDEYDNKRKNFRDNEGTENEPKGTLKENQDNN